MENIDMKFKTKLLTRAIQMMIIGCVSSYSISGLALTAKKIHQPTTTRVATKNDCFVAEKDCLLQVTPTTTSQGQKNFNVKQFCDPYQEQMIFLHELPLKDQLSRRKFLGNKFCKGVVSLSDMELPFSKGPDVEDANDGMLLLETAESGMRDILHALTQMKVIAVAADIDQIQPVQLSDLTIEFQQLKSWISEIANTTSFNGISLLSGSFSGEINIPINRGLKHIPIILTNISTGSSGLNIQDLDISTEEKAHSASLAINTAVDIVQRAITTLESSKPNLQAAIQHDATLTTIDLNDDIIVVKKMGFSAD